MAQQGQTREETIKWLRTHLTQERKQKGANPNTTAICVSCNEKLKTQDEEITDKHFTGKIETFISWKQNEMDVQNDIYENGKLSETYTYTIPLAAIVNAALSNCRINTSGNVNAYKERPLFISVKRNTTRIGHTSFKNNKAAPVQYYMNSKDADWNSIIPLVINWKREARLEENTGTAFTHLIGTTPKKYATK